ncbi:MAG: sensor histidine kinase [Lachnospiraceae bacterium]
MRKNKRKGKLQHVSLSILLTSSVVGIVLLTLISIVAVFIMLYQNSMEENAITTSEQAVVQVVNTLTGYTEDIDELMDLIQMNVSGEHSSASNFFETVQDIRSDVVAVTTYDTNGNLSGCWSGTLVRKVQILENLSYMEHLEPDALNISDPHVVSLFEEEYPWVVTVARDVEMFTGEEMVVAMDIRFASIAKYVDEVGIGQHGYCFIMDTEGHIIYHPQQQLIYSGLKDEKTTEIGALEDGSYEESSIIYTIQTLENCDWRVVGVSYVDEMITSKVWKMLSISFWIFVFVSMLSLGTGMLVAYGFSKPARALNVAMGEFELDAEEFVFQGVGGTREIAKLAESFDHMVLQVQGLMEQVREEEISLKKTELNALQSQINPHFLYNTLDSIAWMCEEERSKEAVEMVNTLARLFRISISKGHELIPIEKEIEHAESYLKIQNYRYKNQFKYSFQVDETCIFYMCNKITLQPIIENAIYHGLNRMIDEGEINIAIYEEENDIVMTVEDNGVGMEAEKCEEILLREDKDKIGIGIKNVHDRIRIYFGETYGLTIESELDEGTKVTIRMPKIEEGSYDKK